MYTHERFEENITEENMHITGEMGKLPLIVKPHAKIERNFILLYASKYYIDLAII